MESFERKSFKKLILSSSQKNIEITSGISVKFLWDP